MPVSSPFHIMERRLHQVDDALIAACFLSVLDEDVDAR
jgi:hypothetical protein